MKSKAKDHLQTNLIPWKLVQQYAHFYKGIHARHFEHFFTDMLPLHLCSCIARRQSFVIQKLDIAQKDTGQLYKPLKYGNFGLPSVTPS